MTIRDILERINKNNQIDDKTKIRWLSELDLQIYEDIVLRHEGATRYMTENPDGTFSPRDFPYKTDTRELIAPERFSRMYEAYLQSETDMQLDELDRYANDLTRFNNAYQEFAAWYNETHMPLQPAVIHTAPKYKRSGIDADPFNRV